MAERMGSLLTRDVGEREEIARNVREAYHLRARQDISPIGPHEMGSVATFLRYAYRVTGIALGNVDKFRSVAEFVVTIDHFKPHRDQPEPQS